MAPTNPNTRKKRAGILSLILIALLLLSGTYAWQYKQHKTTEGASYIDAVLKSVQLVDESVSTDSWTTGTELPKLLHVKNDGADGSAADTQRFEDVYVRISLKEYMERTNVGQVLYKNRLMINTSGDFISFGTKTEADTQYPNHTVVGLTNALSDAPRAKRYFIETKRDDPNGQYGNFMATKIVNEQEYITGGAWTEGSAKAAIPSKDTAKYPGDYHKDGKTEECDYTAIAWDGTKQDKAGNKNSSEFRKYVEIAFESDVEFLSDYGTGGSKSGTPPARGEYWLIDDITENCYAYWMNPLAPQSVTTKFTKSMKLLESPNGQHDDGTGTMADYPLNFYYALHADLEPTLRAYYAKDWKGMDADIESVLFP
ncbi:MAG: hypothetical protein LBG82_03575 [Clostridiales Family XIII bacterium]|jgi:hypothetical protein|nr:hypothetical protein [Clostridiales Family XIII bacterium]